MQPKKFISLLMAMFVFSTTLIQINVSADFSEDDGTSDMRPAGLLTNDLENPLNVEAPMFCWILSSTEENAVQTAYEIVVTDGITGKTAWDSGKVESSEQSYIAYGGDTLKAGYPYSWKVRIWDKNDEMSLFSDSAYFATGLDTSDWNASWISSGASGANHYWYARYEKTLDSEKTVAKVMAYFADVHDYELNVNGKYIGRGQSFDYASETRYQGWDITEAVSGGNITVGLLNRYYGGGQGRAESKEALLGHVNIFYTDGTVDTIVTNSDWKVSTSVPLSGTAKRNSEGDFVEEYNAQKAQEGYSAVGFDVTSWSNASVIGTHPTDDFTKVIAELSKPTDYIVHPVSVTTLSDGTTVADFGTVIPARPQITFSNGTAGNTLTIQTGYALNTDGFVDSSSTATQSTNMTYKYTQKSGPQVYNAWDHLGFRYLSIPSCGETFTTETIAAQVVHTNTPNGRGSTLTTSNEMLNSVYELMKRSALYSIQNSFVDTPTREKGQFLQDSINISDASTTALYERTASKKAIDQFLASADRYWTGDDAGRYNSVYPNCDGKRDIPDFTINFPYWVWSYYMQTGDKATLEKAYPYIKATADYITGSINSSTGLVTQLPGGDGSPNSYQYGIVDWPAVGRYGYDWSGTKTGARTTVNMLSKRTFDMVKNAAAELGNTVDAEDMQSRSDNLKTAINEKLINANGVYCDGLNSSGSQVSHASQHATSYALAFDIAPDDKKEAMADYVAAMGMQQGPMTADILAKSLFNTKENAAALKLFTEPRDNGWAKEVAKGYTFTWEAWDANTTENSQSHGWGSTAAKDMLENFAGVRVTEAGAKRVKIAPIYCDLEMLNASVDTERGAVSISYERSDSKFEIAITIPANMTADIELPVIGNGEFVRTNGEITSEKNDIVQTMTVGSGTYEFSYNGDITVLPEKIEYKEPIHEGIIGENNAADKTYTWIIGEADAAAAAGTLYKDTNDYCDLTVSLGKGDSMNEGILFSASSVREPTTTGQKSLNDTKRYLCVEPKRDGVFSITISFQSQSNNRLYYADLSGDISTPDLSQYFKASHEVITGDIASGRSATRTLNMTAGHKYIIYTYQTASTISAVSYKYTESVQPDNPSPSPSISPAPTENPSTANIEINNKRVNGSTADYSLKINGVDSGVLITAVYNNDGTLYSVFSEPLNGNSAEVSLDIPLDKADIKFMLWDGLDTMKPLVKAVNDKYVSENTNAESMAITLDYANYPLVVGNKSKTDFSDWETRGSSFTLTATVNSDEYSVSDLAWSVEDEDIAYINSKGTGNVSVKGKRTGFTKVRATLPDGDSAVCYISVIDNITRSTVQSLELNTSSLSLAVGADAELIPIINPKDVFENGALDTSLTWTTSNASVANVDNGKVTASGVGTAVITAVSNDIGRMAQCIVTVSENASSAQITADNSAVIDMTVGNTKQFDAKSDSEIVWKSENSFIADVDENGVVTAYSNSNKVRLTNNENYNSSGTTAIELAEKKAVFENGRVQYEKGTVHIYATAKDGGAIAGYEISVSDAPVEVQYVSISADSINISKGNEKNITAVVGPASIIDKNIEWQSSAPNVVSVVSAEDTVYGAAQARLTAKSAGTAVITASSSGKTDSCTVTVTDGVVKVSEVSIEAEAEIDIDEVYRFEANVTQTAENQRLIWVGTDKEKASLNNEGTVKGYKSGMSVIYAVAEDSVNSDAAAKLRAFEDIRVLSNEDISELASILSDAVYAKCMLTVKDSPAELRNLTAPAEAITDNSVNLLWNRATLLDTGGLESYNIYRNNVLIANTKQLGYTSDNLTSSSEYEFRVDAVDNSGNVLASESISVMTKEKSAVINVLDAPYNAKGNGRVLDTYAIQRAINDCPQGGTVYLPEGYIFYSGALFLKSDMTFKVDGILIGSTDSKDYPLMITRWEGWRKIYNTADEWANTSDTLTENHYSHSSLITAGTYDEGENSYDGPYNVKNLVICGKGQINANGFKLGYNEGPNQKTGDGGLPSPVSPAIDQSVRSRNMTFHNAQNVYIKDVIVAYSPSWNIHPIMCDSMTFDNIDIITKGNGLTGAADDCTILNGDGLDPENCTNINIFNNFFCTGDDAVALKSGRNKEGNDLDKPNEYIRVTDCVSKNSKGGFGTGSENASGSRDILFQNIDVDTVSLHGIWMKTNPERGGLSENIQFKDMNITGAKYTANVNLKYSANTSSAAVNPADEAPEYRYLTFENITTGSNNYGFLFEGYSGNYIHDVTIRGCDFQTSKTSTIKYGKNFNIWDTEGCVWSKSNTDNINFYKTGQFEDTSIALTGTPGMVREIDNENRIITVIDMAKPADITAEITSTLGGKQTYSFYDADGNEIAADILSNECIMRVTSPDGAYTADYSIKTTASDIAYDNTQIMLKDTAEYVTAVRQSDICVLENAAVEQIIADIQSVYGFEQMYKILLDGAEIGQSEAVSDGCILSVTSYNGNNTGEYKITIVKKWDFTKAVSEKTVMNTVENYEFTYDGILVYSDSSSDYIDTSVGIHFNGKSPAQNRYIKFTAEADGVLIVNAKRAYTNAMLYYALSSDFSGGKLITNLSNNSSWADGEISVTEGNTYFLYCVSSGMEIKSLSFTPNE